MKKIGVWMAVAALAVAGFAMTGAMAHDEKDTLDGAYRFVRLDTPSGPQETQEGMLVVADGHMCHIRVGKEREAITREDSDEEQTRKAAAAFGSANGTCGTYTLEAGKVTATWAVSLQPGGEGNSSEFLVEREGDSLTLAPAGAPQFKFVNERVR